MKTIHVGGLNPIGRVKTLQDAITKANDDDTIILHKNETISVTIDKNIIIKGNGQTLTVEAGKAGMVIDSPLILENVKFKVNTRANALINNSTTTLDNVSVDLIGPIREFYPVIFNKGTMKINGGRYTKLASENETRTTLDGVETYSYYGGDIHLSDSSNHSSLSGRVRIKNSVLNSINLHGDVDIIDSEIGKYVDIKQADATLQNITFNTHHTEPSVKLDKEHEYGPLTNETKSLYSMKIMDSNIDLYGYNIKQIDDDFLAMYITNSVINVEGLQNTNDSATHTIIDSTVTFKDSTDESKWNMEKTTTSFVRSQINTNMNIETATMKLDKLIGLKKLKEQFKTIMNTIIVQRESNDSNYGFSNNYIFAGDPGTGKTTVANILSEALFEIGAIPENKITKVTVDDLIKGYVGQTAANVREILDKALGGVVFIDEAYQLSVKNGQNTFNDEALSVLIRYMEDHRDELVVIAAGYSKEMKEFLASNVGLSRRFQWLEFDDYTSQEMADIFELIRASYKDEYEDDRLKMILPTLFDKLIQVNLSIPDANGRVTNGGNGGLVRNVYQQVVQHRNNRIVEGGTRLITKDDIEYGFKQQIQAALNRKL